MALYIRKLLFRVNGFEYVSEEYFGMLINIHKIFTGLGMYIRDSILQSWHKYCVQDAGVNCKSK